MLVPEPLLRALFFAALLVLAMSLKQSKIV
jgi:hypothetical protein